MAKKGGGKQDKDADFEVFNKIQEPGASLDDLLLHFDWSADKDMLARLDDWSAVDKMIEHLDDRSALDEMFAHLDDCSVLDKMFAHLDDWSTLDAMFPVDLTLDKLDGLFQPMTRRWAKGDLAAQAESRVDPINTKVSHDPFQLALLALGEQAKWIDDALRSSAPRADQGSDGRC